MGPLLNKSSVFYHLGFLTSGVKKWGLLLVAGDELKIDNLDCCWLQGMKTLNLRRGFWG